MMLKQLRFRFVAVLMLVSVGFLCCFLSMIYFTTARNLETENMEMMRSVNVSAMHGGFTPNAPRPNDRLHYFVLTRLSNGTYLVTSNTGFDLSDEALLLQLYSEASADSDGSGLLKEYSLQYCKTRALYRDSYIFADISDDLAALRSLRFSCITVGAAAFFCLLFLSVLLSKWLIRPVELAWEQQRQFVSDASHELKTPLTVIMTHAEMLSAPGYSPEEKAGFGDNILTMSKRMKFLVEGMLDLARVDNGVVKAAMEPLNYSLLVEQCVLPFEPLFFESDRMLSARITPDILLTGSPAHLAQVTDILLDNAIKYSDPHTETLLTLDTQGRYAVLCADSMGTPLSPEDRERIFRRFYTVDKSRTGNSCGLGLSIAKGIVEEHGGRIWAESDNGHNRFYVKLPL